MAMVAFCGERLILDEGIQFVNFEFFVQMPAGVP